MPKTIDQRTLEVLTSAVEITHNHVTIMRQLTRPEYVKVNDALVALGGEWNRKAKAHVFPTGTDVEALINNLCITGEYSTARDVGWFPTPDEVADELVELAGLDDGHRILEPSAGEGALVKAMLRTGRHDLSISVIEHDVGRRANLVRLAADVNDQDDISHVVWLPIDKYGSDVLDFMDFDLDDPGTDIESFDRVVMNPPFARVGAGDHLDHVRHAFEMLAPHGILVSILPCSVEFRQDKRHKAFRAWVKDLRGEWFPLPDDAFKPTGTGVRTVILRLRRAE